MVDDVRAQSLFDLRKRKSVKWRQFPADVLPLPVAEMDFETAPAIKRALQDMLDRSDTGYLGSFPELTDGFASFAAARWGWQVDKSQIRTATDVGVGTVEVMRTLIKAGDKVMLNSPVYDNIWRWIAEVGAQLIDTPLTEDNLNFTLDLVAIEAEYKNGVKIHILCHPHNPVGVIFKKSELEKLAALAKRYQVYIISDEIHAPLVYDSNDFTPFLNVSDDARAIGICITSASKAFNLAGLKCAVIITQNEELKLKINTMPIAVGYRASLFGAASAAAAFAESSDWLDVLLIKLDENRKLIKNIIESKLPAIKYRIPDFGYLAWLDIAGLNLGSEGANVILTKGKLALNAGIMYGPKHSNFVRFNFGTSPEIITEAFNRIEKSL